MLADLVGTVGISEPTDLYAAIQERFESPPESLWLDTDLLAEEDLGAIRLARRAWPHSRITLVSTDQNTPLLDVALSLGCHVLRRPLRLREVSAIIGASRPAPDDTVPAHLLAGLSDQLNNPLAALAGHLQLLQLSIESGQHDDLLDHLSLAVGCADRIQAALVKLSLLAGQSRPIITEFSINTLVADLEKDFGAGMMTFDGPLVAAFGDDEMTTRALAAILRVAADLGGPDPVQVRCTSGEHNVRIECRLGTPLPLPCPAEEVLQPFRLHRVLRDPDLGLDAAVAAALAQAQNGVVQPVVETGFLSGFVLVLPGR